METSTYLLSKGHRYPYVRLDPAVSSFSPDGPEPGALAYWTGAEDALGYQLVTAEPTTYGVAGQFGCALTPGNYGFLSPLEEKS